MEGILMKKAVLHTTLLLITFGLLATGVSTVSFAYPEWTLQIGGQVTHPFSITLEELAAMPQTTVYARLRCYEVFLTSGNWTGVRLRVLLEEAGFDQQAESVKFYAEDGYESDLSITEAMREDVIIAYQKDGQPLPETLRLVLPGANGDQWIAMITHITVSMNESSLPKTPPITMNESSLPKTPPITIIPPPEPQESPTPQPTPTPKPMPSPAPSPSPPITHPDMEPLTIAWTVTAVVTATFISAGLLVYFKKRKH
jgi:DMSO/TMAO reductase YedYZ molybdopterin-dependent catalytic subunit